MVICEVSFGTDGEGLGSGITINGRDGSESITVRLAQSKPQFPLLENDTNS